MLDRRAFLAGSTALGAIAASGCATRIAEPATNGDAALKEKLTGWFDEDLTRAPTFATNLGIDTGELAALRGQLGDNSMAENERNRQRAIARLAELRRVDTRRFSEEGQLDFDIALFRHEIAAQGARFPYGSGGGFPSPYVVTQLSGSYYGVPDFLDTQHPIKTAEDAEAYLSRLTQFGRNLENEAERIRYDASIGVIPPDFVIDKTVANLQRMRAVAPAQSPMVRSIVRRAREQNLGDYQARAEQIVSGPVARGLDSQIAAFQAIRPRAVHEAGIWRLPQGEDYYRYAIRAMTTVSMTGAEVHRMGLEQVAELQGRIDTLLRAQGYTQGSVGARLSAMNADPRFLFANTDAGRQELLTWLNEQVRELRPRLARVFNRMPRAAVEIRRVPVEIQAGAPGGYYQGASLDGSRPGAYYINLANTADWPRYTLPTLTYHEAEPGHHFQISISREAGELPIYRRVGGFSAYNEGWALYAERVADELGAYEKDPFGRIGYLQSYLFRAVRLVVDSGMHHERWSRERAIQYMMENNARPEDSTIREIERYAVWPGQALAYKVGQTVIANLRDEAERRPGFDIKRFHDAVLLGGSMPLELLEGRVRSLMLG